MNLRLKKIILWLFSFLTRALWRLFVFVAIFVAVVVSAGRELAPLLREHKAWLEANLTKNMGETVAMQEVDAHWEGLVPELAVKKLTIGNVLQVDSVLLRVDLLASARAFALVFDRLDISHASVIIPVGESSMEQVFNLQAYLDFLFGSADIRVRDLEIILQQNEKNQLQLQVDRLTVQNSKYSHWLNGAVSVGKQNPVDKKNPIQLTLKFDGDADNIFADQGRAHVDLGDEKNLALIRNFVHQVFDDPTIARVSSMKYVKGQLWLAWENQRINWVSETAIKKLVFSSPSTRVFDFNGRLAGYIQMENGLGKEYFIHTLPNQEISINQRPYTLPVFAVQYNNNNLRMNDGLFSEDTENSRVVKIYVPDFNLATVTQYLDLLPSKTVRDILKKLNPLGEVQNVLVTLPLQEAANQQMWDPLVQANLVGVAVSAWQGAPALTSVDGYVQASATSGFVELDSEKSFSMHYKTLYRKPMRYDRAHGRISWQIKKDDQHIYVGSPDLDFYGDDGELRGAFWLNIPPPHSPQPAELYLSAGLLNAQVKDRNKYLPYTLDASLSHWLANSLKDGSLSESGFIYRGALAKNQPQEQALIFFSKVKDGRMRFDPAWPELSDMNGSVLVDNGEVRTTVKRARFLRLKLNQVNANLKVSANQQGHFLSLEAMASGPGNDILKVMRDTPLQKIFGNTFDGWRLEDNVSGHINAGVRIGAAEETEYQEIDLYLDGNDLLVGKIDLPLKQLKGDIHYSSVAGLSSTPLSASLWGQDQKMNITPVAAGSGLPDIAVNMRGNIDVDAVAIWTQLAFIHFLKGVIPVTGTLTVPLGTITEGRPDAIVSIKSDMEGVAIDLPEPFKKLPATKSPATINVAIWKDKQTYRIDYGNLMSALLEHNNDRKLKGDIVINQSDQPIAELPDFLRIRANMNQASLSEWLPVMDRYAAFVKTDELKYKKQQNPRSSEENSTANNRPVFDLLIKQLGIGSLKLDDIKLLIDYRQGQAATNHWNVAFQNALMAGNYHYFDDTGLLPEVDFDTVKLGEAEASPEQKTIIESDSSRVDPLADVIPQELPAMRVHAKQVILQGNDVGDWRFTLNPDQEGAILNDLYGTMPGLAIKGIEKDRGATMSWYRTGNDIRTEVSSKLNLGNEEGVKKLFGIDRIIEADKTEFLIAAKWQGSPAMLSFERMQGDVSFTAEKGRFLNRNASTDLMRVINVFNFTTWARRLQLDFTDLYKTGVSFDKVTAELSLDQGKVTFDKPLVMVGPSGRFELKGTIDSVRNFIDASLIVTIPVNKNATWIAALAAGLPVAAGVWAVSKIFSDQIDQLSSVNYSISGTLDEPTVTFVSLLPALSKTEKDKK